MTASTTNQHQQFLWATFHVRERCGDFIRGGVVAGNGNWVTTDMDFGRSEKETEVNETDDIHLQTEIVIIHTQ